MPNFCSTYLSPVPKVFQSSHVKKFLVHLAVEKEVSASTQNQSFNALLYLLRNVLEKELEVSDNVIRAGKSDRIPVVFSKKEIKKLFKHFLEGYLLHAKLIYACGLRVTECIRLRVKDIDFENQSLIVRFGKGNKDKVTLLKNISLNLTPGAQKYYDHNGIPAYFEKFRR